LKSEDFQRPGAVDTAKGGNPAASSVDSSVTSTPPADQVKPSESTSVKSTEPGLKPDAAQKTHDPKTPSTETEKDKESLSRRWSTVILGRDKSKGKADQGK
jgi:hypothetical protein